MLHTEICNNSPDPGEPVLGPPQPSLALRKPVSLLFLRIPVTYSRGAPWARSCQRDSDNPQHSVSHSGGAEPHQPESSPQSFPSSGEKGKSGRMGKRPRPGGVPSHLVTAPPASKAWTFHREHRRPPRVPRVSAELGVCCSPSWST